MARWCLVFPLLLAASCSTPRPVAVAPPPPVVEQVVIAMPQPPRGAAPNQRVPERLADGNYATPNRALTPAATLWHLRAGLNVAALGCDDSERTVSAAYERLLARNRRTLADAYRDLSAEHRDTAAFETAMTQLYNYYAQPPAQPGFCAAARAVLAEAEALPVEGLAMLAPDALARIDRPFTDFYAAYDRYRTDLAAWHAGSRVAPRLAYDPAVLMADQSVTGGRRDVAAR